MIDYVSQHCDETDDIVLEVQKYLHVKVSESETLEWWREHKVVILVQWQLHYVRNF